MSNIAGKAYAMNVLTPSTPRITWVNKLLFMVSRGQPSTLGGLLGLSLIHFARWAFVRPQDWPVFDKSLEYEKTKIKSDYMIFCSNFNGTWDQYIDAFSDGIPNGLNLFWYSATKYPDSIPITPFKDYITHNQIDTNYYFNATPGAAQRDVKAGLRVRRAVLALETAHAEQDAETFAKTFATQLGTVQNYLGDPGFGPVASLDTENADLNREAIVRETAKRAAAENKAAEAKAAKANAGT
ncbi:MAG: hypothetical protein AAF415_09550 [Pseudomonadota bacterium]